MTRAELSIRNAKWYLAGNIINALLSFLLRKVFIDYLGVFYLGISGLFGEILGLLNFAELGFGTAITFLLYKPIAEDDQEQTKLLLKFYKTIYRVVIAVVIAFGLGFLPFLNMIVHTQQPVNNLHFLYLLYLVNSISSYIAAYKTTYVDVLQANHINTRFQLVVNTVTIFMQAAVIIFIKRYEVYLLVTVGLAVIARVVYSIYISRKYPIFRSKVTGTISKTDQKSIWGMVRTLLLQTVGAKLITQSDSIITASLVGNGITAIGLMSNYLMIKNIVMQFAASIFVGTQASAGNLVASEEKGKQLRAFYLITFIAALTYGFCFIAFVSLSSPFISVFFGSDKVVDKMTVFLFFSWVYFAGQRLAIEQLRNINGAYHIGKTLVIIEAVINLALSVIAARWIGLPGVYLGTLISSLFVYFIRPFKLLRQLYQTTPKIYFQIGAGPLAICLVSIVLIDYLKTSFFYEATFVNLIILAPITILIPLALFTVFYHRSSYVVEMLGIIFKRKDG